ncbi:MAG: hypothetical protein AAFQ45_15240 [Pseudomonadota bacterium]
MRSGRSDFHRQWVGGVAVALAGALMAAACTQAPPAAKLKPSGISCVDDSPRCLKARRTALAQIMDDNKRTWIKRAPSAHAYAAGVRLFAFKTQKRSLSCGELGAGRREASNAARVLRSPAGQSLTPAQRARGVILGDEVARELSREMRRRCRAKS